MNLWGGAVRLQCLAGDQGLGQKRGRCNSSHRFCIPRGPNEWKNRKSLWRGSCVEKFVVACLQRRTWSSRYYTCPQFIIDIWILHVSDITKQSTSDLSFRFGLSFRLRCASEVRGHCTLHIAHCTFPTGTYCYHSFFPRRVF